MEKLSKSEEQLMAYLWQKKTAYLKELIEAYPDPKPAPTTVATLLKRMQDKQMVSFTQRGSSREYFPLVEKPSYFSKKVKHLIRDYFDDSAIQFASFFAKEIPMDRKQWEELKKIVDKQLKKQDDDSVSD
ncbi:MAG: BlaI/MecI/CopY family transcriptional regulator [Capnocytophaga sp.]|nr:BlaI/MecI/CopY family transcriptional regulator [Capnocytophaga sp.]